MIDIFFIRLILYNKGLYLSLKKNFMKTVYKETQIIYDRLSPRENNFYNNKKILILGADGLLEKLL